jgi:hypothetical protein
MRRSPTVSEMLSRVAAGRYGAAVVFSIWSLTVTQSASCRSSALDSSSLTRAAGSSSVEPVPARRRTESRVAQRSVGSAVVWMTRSHATGGSCSERTSYTTMSPLS